MVGGVVLTQYELERVLENIKKVKVFVYKSFFEQINKAMHRFGADYMRREEHEIVVSLRDEESEIKLSNDEFGVNKLVEIVTGAVLHAEKAEFRVRYHNDIRHYDDGGRRTRTEEMYSVITKSEGDDSFKVELKVSEMVNTEYHRDASVIYLRREQVEEFVRIALHAYVYECSRALQREEC